VFFLEGNFFILHKTSAHALGQARLPRRRWRKKYSSEVSLFGEQFIARRESTGGKSNMRNRGTYMQLCCLFVTNWFWVVGELLMSVHQLSAAWVLSRGEINIKLQGSTLKMATLSSPQNSTYIYHAERCCISENSNILWNHCNKRKPLKNVRSRR